ncbi:MAG: TIGR00725 family protein [Asgard group archaeon]|nr:TIGR00725 family protein [Asgard group archaeon]
MDENQVRKLDRRKLVAIIGGSVQNCTKTDYDIAYRLGKLLIVNGYRLVTGGYGGVMEAASKGARNADEYREGDIVGIISSISPEDANEYCDIVIATGIGYARNQIITASADVVVAIGGGSGTLSEIAFAWQLNKKIIAFTSEGWSGHLADKTLDSKRKDKVIPVDTPEQVIEVLKSLL